MPDIYGDRWEIITSIGEGGQAHTFRVKDLRDNSDNWVLKRLKNKNRLGRFEREIEALKAIDAPTIPKIIDYSIEDSLYIVTKFLGVDLRKFLANKQISINESLGIFQQIVSAVESAHNKAEITIIHRDIKPNNVIISANNFHAYLIDFGICQIIGGEQVMLTGQEPFGNPAFAAPECYLGREEEPGPECDIYSLGKLLYWMISNGSYINREDLTSTAIENIFTDNKLIQFYLTRLIHHTVVKDPRNRWNVSKLLEEVNKTIRLIERVQEFESKNLHIMTDGFGIDNNFNQSNSKSVTTSPQGNPPGDHDFAVAFTNSTQKNLQLESIIIGLSFSKGNDVLELSILKDKDDKPNQNKALEQFTVEGDGDRSIRVINIESQENPILHKASRYWLSFSAGRTNNRIRLWAAPLDFRPRPSLIARRSNGGKWEVGESKSGPGYAIRIIGSNI